MYGVFHLLELILFLAFFWHVAIPWFKREIGRFFADDLSADELEIAAAAQDKSQIADSAKRQPASQKDQSKDSDENTEQPSAEGISASRPTGRTINVAGTDAIFRCVEYAKNDKLFTEVCQVDHSGQPVAMAQMETGSIGDVTKDLAAN